MDSGPNGTDIVDGSTNRANSSNTNSTSSLNGTTSYVLKCSTAPLHDVLPRLLTASSAINVFGATGAGSWQAGGPVLNPGAHQNSSTAGGVSTVISTEDVSDGCDVVAGAVTITDGRLQSGVRFSYPTMKAAVGVMEYRSSTSSFDPWAFLRCGRVDGLRGGCGVWGMM